MVFINIETPPSLASSMSFISFFALRCANGGKPRSYSASASLALRATPRRAAGCEVDGADRIWRTAISTTGRR
jgi:hypothetical protein